MNLVNLYNDKSVDWNEEIEELKKKIENRKKTIFMSDQFRPKLIHILGNRFVAAISYISFYLESYQNHYDPIWDYDSDMDNRSWDREFVKETFGNWGLFINDLMDIGTSYWSDIIEWGIIVNQYPSSKNKNQLTYESYTLIDCDIEYGDDWNYWDRYDAQEPFPGFARYLTGVFLENKKEILEIAKAEEFYDMIIDRYLYVKGYENIEVSRDLSYLAEKMEEEEKLRIESVERVFNHFMGEFSE